MIPQKAEIWWINFDPKVGSEMGKKRPAIVISSNSIGKLPLRIVIPVTSWQKNFDNKPWLIKITSDKINNLKNDSVADTFQIKSVSNDRFVAKIGTIMNSKMQEIIMGVRICIET